MRSVIFLLVLSLMIGLPVYAGSDSAVADEVIALAKAQWAAGIAKDTDKQVSYLADDYTEFNQGYPTRIDGKELNVTFMKAADEGAGKTLVADMANAKVQVYGDVAILSYNYIGSGLTVDGEVEPNLAKSTRVYAKIDGAWKLVHANFAPVN
jgi:ketosteroid isomerase-like protein